MLQVICYSQIPNLIKQTYPLTSKHIDKEFPKANQGILLSFMGFLQIYTI